MLLSVLMTMVQKGLPDATIYPPALIFLLEFFWLNAICGRLKAVSHGHSQLAAGWWLCTKGY